jgi:hypothetical protein
MPSCGNPVYQSGPAGLPVPGLARVRYQGGFSLKKPALR